MIAYYPIYINEISAMLKDAQGTQSTSFSDSRLLHMFHGSVLELIAVWIGLKMIYDMISYYKIIL